MECPFCGSRWIRKDVAPARSYALMFLGIALLLPAAVLSPEILNAFGQANTPRFFVFGVAVLLYGFLDALRHGNRYCGTCGCRLHAVRGGPQRQERVVRQAGEGPAASSGSVNSTPRKTGEEKTLNPNTPLEPVLKCLRFKNEKMRLEAVATLQAMTGEDFGTDADAWDAWWAANKDAYKARQRENH